MVNDAADMVNGWLISPCGYVSGGLGWALGQMCSPSTELSSPAKEGDPVFRDGCGSADRRRRTGCPACAGHDSDMRGERLPPYFFTLLASILMVGSSILVVNAVVTSNGFSMPRQV